MRRRLLIPVALFSFLIIGAAISINSTSNVSAWFAGRQDTFGYFDNRELDSNYYYGNPNSTVWRNTGGSILPPVYDGNINAIPDSVNNKESYYNFLYSTYQNEDDIQKSMVSFLVRTMLGHGVEELNAAANPKLLTEADWSEFNARLNQPSITFHRELHNGRDAVYHQGQERDGSVKSRNSAKDAATIDGEGQTDIAIVLRHNGVKVYALFVVCANPDGALDKGLPPVVVTSNNFDLQPTAGAELTPDVSNPEKVIFKTGVISKNNPAGSVVNSTISRRYFVRRASGAEVNITPGPSPVSESRAFNSDFNYPDQERTLSSIDIGDYACVQVTVAPAAGIANSSGVVTSITEASRQTEYCERAATKPYFKVFGGEVLTGADWTNAAIDPKKCEESLTGGIYSWATKKPGLSNNYVGSSAQLTVSSLLEVNSFYSSSLRSSGDTVAPKGLTFANSSQDSESSAESEFGGGSENRPCIIDYFNDTRDESIFLDLRDPAAQEKAMELASRGVTRAQFLFPSPRDDGIHGDVKQGIKQFFGYFKQIAMYIDGDVSLEVLEDYFTYPNLNPDGSPFESWSDYPNLVVIVRGDIYINNLSFSEDSTPQTVIDGLYIAQPREDGTGGTIYTCGNVGSPPGLEVVYDACNKPLIVNGGLIAKQIKFQRMYGSLKDATPNEKPNFNTGLGTGAAEVINYTPEMFLAPSPLAKPGGKSVEEEKPRGKYQSVKVLPPSL